MELFDVYPLYDVTPVSARGMIVTDDKGMEYLDFYGGHAVISIGHSHPHYVKRISRQLNKIGFYSNSVHNPVQKELAQKLGKVSGCEGYRLFLCNSGAEANENALKLASFETGKSKVIAFQNGFHGRTSAAVAATDNPKIKAPINLQQEVVLLPLNDEEAFVQAMEKGDICAVILETVQGVGGLDEPTMEFYGLVAQQCKELGIKLIADEVQCGYGRTGKFFGFQHYGVTPDLITIAKGMGNGFPLAGVLIKDDIKAVHGRLGTTFGGNHLACAAGLAVLEVIESENLVENAKQMGRYFKSKAEVLPQVKQVKGKGLMLGLEFDTSTTLSTSFEVADLRKRLIHNQKVFTGGAKDKYVLRILPALNCSKSDLDLFFEGLKKELE